MTMLSTERPPVRRVDRRVVAAAVRETLDRLALDLEDREWRRLGDSADTLISYDSLRRLIEMCRLAYLAMPLIRRAVNLRSFYTWGAGVDISAEHPQVNEVVQQLLSNPINKEELFDPEAQLEIDRDLQNSGNVYIVCFTDRLTGAVTLHTLNAVQIQDIICNPDNAHEPWYYKRVWTYQKLDLSSGVLTPTERTEYYPDISYRPRVMPKTIGGNTVHWESPIAHLKSGGIKHLKYGIPDTYTAIDWARVHKGVLEDWASLVRSISRFAFTMTTEEDVDEAWKKFNSTLETVGTESNPPPTGGSVVVQNPGAKLEAIPKTGAIPSISEARELRLMIASALDLPDHVLSGDVNVGNRATAMSLDKPTELMALSRQRMWGSHIATLADYAIRANIRARQGILQGNVDIDPVTGREVIIADYDTTVMVQWPDIKEHSSLERVRAIVSAATLDGKHNAETIPFSNLVELLLTALGVEDASEIAATTSEPEHEPEPPTETEPEVDDDNDDD